MDNHHAKIRPPAGACDVERLTDEGKWIPDDGQPGIAFSGRDERGFPIAWYAECPRRGCRPCTIDLASDRTYERFRCSNGYEVPVRRKRSPKPAPKRAPAPPRPPVGSPIALKRRILRELRDLHATWLDHPPAGFATEDAFRVAQGIAKAIDLVQAVRP